MTPIQSPTRGLASWNVTVIDCPIVKQDLVAAIELLAETTIGMHSNNNNTKRALIFK
jgi:hypothetical protein